MSLQLNDPRIEYREFFGKYNEQMPRLLAEGSRPLSVADLMRRRLEVANSDDPQLRTSWLDNYFDTSDGIAYHPNVRIKVALDAVLLRSITPQDTLTNGALGINAMTYASMHGEEIRAASLTTGTPLTKRAVMNSPIWNALARHDKPLLREYTKLVFTEAKQRFGYDENMGIYLGATPETPALQAWIVGSIYGRSGLGGDEDLGGDLGCLVGAAASARVRAPRRSSGRQGSHQPTPPLSPRVDAAAARIARINRAREELIETEPVDLRSIIEQSIGRPRNTPSDDEDAF